MTGGGPAGPDVREALARALTELRPAMSEIASALAQIVEGDAPAYPERDREQFLNAFETLMRDALEERGEETRRFVLETAIPGMLASGRTVLSLVEGHVAFFTLLNARLLEAMPAEMRDAAALWQAWYTGGFMRDVIEVAWRTAGNP